MKYKATKIKGAVILYCNEDPGMQMVQDFEERVGKMGRRFLFKEPFRFAEGIGVEHPRSLKTEVSSRESNRGS